MDTNGTTVQHRQRQRFNQKPKQESDNERKPFNHQAAAPSSPASRQSTPRDKKPGNDEAKHNVSKKKRLVCFKCGGKGHPARLCPSADDCQYVDEVGRNHPATLTVICLAWTGVMILLRGSIPGLAGEIELAAGKSCEHSLILLQWTMYFRRWCALSTHWRRPPSRKGANGSRIKHYGQWRFRVKTCAGSNTNTTWEVAGVRKPLISASRLLERGHKLVLDERPRIQCKNGDTIPLERCRGLFAIRLWIPQVFPRQC